MTYYKKWKEVRKMYKEWRKIMRNPKSSDKEKLDSTIEVLIFCLKRWG